LREKTAKLGAIARATSIFGVNEIILYPDDPRRRQESDMELCGDILQYLETPQYLRRRIFKLTPTLRFTGIVAPLQTPHHNVPPTIATVRIGDIREGFVVSRSGDEAVVDAGLERFVYVAGHNTVRERVTVRLVSVGKNLRGEIVKPSKIATSPPDIGALYRGYKVKRTSSLGKLLRETNFGLKIGTSRYGTPIMDIWPSLTAQVKKADSVLVAFGSPKLGLKQILQLENLDARNVFDQYINTVPNQQTATVRTEEAILVSLGILNLARQAEVTGHSP